MNTQHAIMGAWYDPHNSNLLFSPKTTQHIFYKYRDNTRSRSISECRWFAILLPRLWPYDTVHMRSYGIRITVNWDDDSPTPPQNVCPQATAPNSDVPSRASISTHNIDYGRKGHRAHVRRSRYSFDQRTFEHALLNGFITWSFSTSRTKRSDSISAYHRTPEAIRMESTISRFSNMLLNVEYARISIPFPPTNSKLHTHLLLRVFVCIFVCVCFKLLINRGVAVQRHFRTLLLRVRTLATSAHNLHAPTCWNTVRNVRTTATRNTAVIHVHKLHLHICTHWRTQNTSDFHSRECVRSIVLHTLLSLCILQAFEIRILNIPRVCVCVCLCVCLIICAVIYGQTDNHRHFINICH